MAHPVDEDFVGKLAFPTTTDINNMLQPPYVWALSVNGHRLSVLNRKRKGAYAAENWQEESP